MHLFKKKWERSSQSTIRHLMFIINKKVKKMQVIATRGLSLNVFSKDVQCPAVCDAFNFVHIYAYLL